MRLVADRPTSRAQTRPATHTLPRQDCGCPLLRSLHTPSKSLETAIVFKKVGKHPVSSLTLQVLSPATSHTFGEEHAHCESAPLHLRP